MRVLICLAVAVVSAGCTSMPSRFTLGDRFVHPRYGYQVTNETDDTFDLEVCVMDYSFILTAGAEQLERAKRVFVRVARHYAMEKGRIIDSPPPVELYVHHVRNQWDGTNTIYVSKQIRWRGTGYKAGVDSGENSP